MARLRAVIVMKDEQAAVLGASLGAALARLETALAEAAALRSEAAASWERERRLGLRVAELERRLWMDSTVCRLRSNLDTAAAHGITALDAISAAIAGKPGYRHSAIA